MRRFHTEDIAASLGSWCDSLVERSLVTAVSAIVGVGESRAGAAGGDEAARADALFDLASLTKPVSATLALSLDAAGDLPLSTRVGDVWTGAGRIAGVDLERLLRHRSGLRRWMPLYATCGDADEVAARLIGDDWLRDDEESLYSDLDYVLWCLTVEKALGRSYLELLDERVLAPLGVDDVRATPDAAPWAVPCALPTGREVELARQEGLEIDEMPPPSRGQAQDGNCRFLGRPAGHAGLFASAAALWSLAREWCHPERLFSPEQVERALGEPGRFALGWYRGCETAAGRALGPTAYGHDGFTGGTLWIDPQRDLVLVALCHRTGLDVDLSGERARLAETAVAAGPAADAAALDPDAANG